MQQLYEKIIENPIIQKLIADNQQLEDLKIIADAANISGKNWAREAKNIVYTVHDDYLQIVSDLPNKRKSKRRKRKRFEFNPGSSNHIRLLVIDYLGISKDLLPETATGLPSVKADNLKRFADDNPILQDIRLHNLMRKMLSTYLQPAYNREWESSDGRVRSSYNLSMTKTGRLSSSDPNLQNIPAPEKEPGTLLAYLPIKNIFTNTYKRGLLMNIDYSGMELRIMASVSGCQAMLHAFENEMDVHSMVALFATQNIPITSVTHAQIKEFREKHNLIRYKFKKLNFLMLYGGGANTLHKLANIPIEEGEELIEKYYEAFSEVADYQHDIVQFAKKHGYVESVYGRRLYLPYINDTRPSVEAYKKQNRRTALNMPIQSAASDTLIAALGIINQEMKKRKMKSKLINTVHDSIMFDCLYDEIDKVASLGVNIMENISEWSKLYYPHINYDWLICPLKADVEVGTHYGVMEHYHG